MSPKNEIKMINVQKSYLVQFVIFVPILSYSIHMVIISPFSLI